MGVRGRSRLLYLYYTHAVTAHMQFLVNVSMSKVNVINAGSGCIEIVLMF